MRTLRVIICDDEALAVERMELALKHMPGVEVVESARDGDELLSTLRQASADVVFLDIEMPKLDGFDVIESLSAMEWSDHDPPLVVFTTAHSEFAAKAFETGALDFIPKPVRLSRLEQAVSRARIAADARQARRRLAELSEEINELKRRHKPEPEVPHFWLRKGGNVVRVDVSSIHWISAEGEFIRFHTSGESYQERGSITRVAERLKALGFMRVHRSAVVNTKQVQALQRTRWGALEIALKSGAHLRVSRPYRRDVLAIANADASTARQK